MIRGYKIKITSIVLITLIAISGCGGGKDVPINQKSVFLEGTAKIDGEIPNNRIYIKGSAGNKIETFTDDSGKFKVDVRKLTAPYLLKITIEENKSYYSLALDKGVINLHLLSDFIFRNLFARAGKSIDVEFDGNLAFQAFSAAEINATSIALTKILSIAYQDYSIPYDFDFLKKQLDESQDAFDVLLKQLQIKYKDNLVTIRLIDRNTNITADIITNLNINTDLSLADLEPPSTPAYINPISASASNIVVVWNSSIDNIGISGYRVYRNNSEIPIATVSAPVFRDKELTASTEYCYVIESIDGNDNKSQKSNSFCVTTSIDDDSISPVKITIDSPVIVSASKIEISWPPATANDILGYDIFRKTDAEFIRISTIITSGYTDRMLGGNTEFCYRVQAFDAAGNRSTISDSVCASTIDDIDVIAPAKINDLSVTNASSSLNNVITWSQSEEIDVVGYNVYIIGNNTKERLTTVTKNQYLREGLELGAQYCYIVTAFDAVGNESEDSNTVCFELKETPILSVIETVISEGDYGSKFVELKLTLSTTSDKKITLSYMTKDGTAETYTDYTPIEGFIEFEAGSSEATLSIQIISDIEFEENETFFIELSEAENSVKIENNPISIKIENDDQPITSQDLFVDVSLMKKSGCTACHAIDKKIVGPAWLDVAEFYKDDPGARESLRKFVARGGFTGKWQAIGAMPPYSPRVSDKDIGKLVDGIIFMIRPEIAISISNASIVEGDEGKTILSFPVFLSGAATEDVSFDYITKDATATKDEDYSFTSGTLIIPAGELEGKIEIIVYGDTLPENNERFELILTNSSENSFLVNNLVLGLIADGNDSKDPKPLLPMVSVKDAVVIEGTRGGNFVEIQFELDRPSNSQVVFGYKLQNKSAIVYSDFSPAIVDSWGNELDTIGFGAGELRVSRSIYIATDDEIEQDESFTISLENISSNAIFEKSTATVTITNDDNPYTKDNIPLGIQSAEWLGCSDCHSIDSGPINSSWRDISLKHKGNILLNEYFHKIVTDIYSGGSYEDKILAKKTSPHRSLEQTTSLGVIRSIVLGILALENELLTVVNTSNIRMIEGVDGATIMSFPFLLSGESDTDISFSYATENAEAISGEDYENSQGKHTIVAGDTESFIDVKIFGDNKNEGDEKFILNYFSPSENTILLNQFSGPASNMDPLVYGSRVLGTILNGSDNVQKKIFRMESTIPASGSGQVSVTSDFQIQFNHDLQSSSVISSNIRLNGIDNIPINVSYGKDTKSIVISPADSLPESTDFVMTVDSEISDIDENTLGRDYNSWFSSKAWLASEIIAKSPTRFVPQMISTANTQGDILVLWTEKHSVFYIVNDGSEKYFIVNGLSYSRFYSGKTLEWGEPIVVQGMGMSDIPASGQEYPLSLSTLIVNQIEMDEFGNSILVWGDYSDAGRLWSKVFHAELGWQDKVLLDDGDYRSNSQIKITMNQSGQAIVCWQGKSGSKNKSYDVDVGWQEVVDEALCPYSVNKQGNFIFKSKSGDRKTTFLKEYNAIDGLVKDSSYETQIKSGFRSYSFDFATNKLGKTIEVWEQTPIIKTFQNIYASIFSDGSFSNPVILDTNYFNRPFQPQVTINDTGNIFVVWKQQRAGTSEDYLWSARYNDSDAFWGKSKRIMKLDFTPDFKNDNQLVGSNSGDQLFVWYSLIDEGDSSLGYNLHVKRFSNIAEKWTVGEIIAVPLSKVNNSIFSTDNGFVLVFQKVDGEIAVIRLK